jgi:tRNA G18 (ribose-2'-O)-methylase SpoU
LTRLARLVPDGIEHPANAGALLDAAAMFGIDCLFRDTRGLKRAWSTELGGGELPAVDSIPIADLLPIVAVENASGARSVYHADLPFGRPSIVVGNERFGIRGDLLRAASTCVEIPMPGRGVNTLNVASAAAVAMYYLLAEARQPNRQIRGSARRRPALMLVAPADHVETGSVIRSAAAFGWRSLALDDRLHTWFGVSRAERTEGRAAARSHRNATRVIPMSADGAIGFRRVVVAGVRVDGPPLQRVDLAGGPNCLLVLPDEEPSDQPDWGRLGPHVEFARLDLPTTTHPNRYRLTASIVLAEAARQLGPVAPSVKPDRRRRGLTYERALLTAPTAVVDLVSAWELRTY